MMREALPQRRYSESSDFIHLGIRYSMQIGVHPDGRVGEVFLLMHKAAGTFADVNARDTAILISMAIQHGAPLDRMLAAITRDQNGKPEGLAGAVLEHLHRWKPHGVVPVPVAEAVDDAKQVKIEPQRESRAMTRGEARSSGFTGDQCTNCNSMRMKIAGHCMVCEDCGTTTGCS